jgi:murein L,D-transpeptidase YcbB/YkuD
MNDSKPSWFDKRIIVATTEREHDAVTYVQRVLRCNETGDMDEDTTSHIRGFQLLFGLRPTGLIDEATARQVNNIFPEGA